MMLNGPGTQKLERKKKGEHKQWAKHAQINSDLFQALKGEALTAQHFGQQKGPMRLHPQGKQTRVFCERNGWLDAMVQVKK